MTTSTDRPVTTQDRAAVPMAVLLWALVVVALAYGVSQTLSTVVALFG